ncbi:MAG: hypothetical protein AAGA67_12635, partial [Cyanobacteria bacterium P01_F01_bin.153]
AFWRTYGSNHSEVLPQLPIVAIDERSHEVVLNDEFWEPVETYFLNPVPVGFKGLAFRDMYRRQLQQFCQWRTELRDERVRGYSVCLNEGNGKPDLTKFLIKRYGEVFVDVY